MKNTDFKERLIEEYQELSIKVEKLEDFIKNNPVFQTLNDEDRLLMIKQCGYMGAYKYMLKRRIENFDKKEKN